MIKFKMLYAIMATMMILVALSPVLAEPDSSEKIIKADLIFGPEKGLNPAYEYTGWYMREAGIYETLFALDKDMNIVPELATGFDQVSDTEYKIHLRTDVKFHDGSPMNADAVVKSLNDLISSSDRRSEYSFIDSVKKDDESTITIKTKDPYAPTIASLADPLASIVNTDVDLNKTPSGTGPFKFESFEKGVKMAVKRNDDYWGRKANLSGAVLYFVSDAMTRALQLEGYDIDITRGLPQTEVKKIESDKDLEVLQKETLRLNLLYVNTKKAPFDNPSVRQALNYAINRQEIVDTALEGVGGVPAIGPFSSDNPWSANDELKAYAYDPSKAKELLEQAGITDTNGDGLLEFDGKPFNITIKTYTSRAENKPSAEVVAAQLEKIGIKSNVQVLEVGAIRSDLSKGDYDMALYSWSTGTTGDPDYFLSKHFESTGAEAKKTGYSNPDVDSWIKAGRTTFDQKERMNYYTKAQERVLKDSPEIFLFYLNELVGVNKNVKGYVIYPSCEITFLTPDISLGE